MSVSPDPVQNLIAEAGLLVWSAAAGAKGYAVYADDVVIGFSKGNSFRDENIYEIAPVYDVRSIGAHGNMSEPAGSGAPVSADELNRALNPSLDTSVSQIVNDIFSIRKDYLESASPVNVQVYDLYGRMIESANNVTYYSFSNLQNSIFILRVISEEGETRRVKIRR